MSDQPMPAPPPGGNLPGATPPSAPAVPPAETTLPEFETQPAPPVSAPVEVAAQATRPAPPITPPDQIAPPPAPLPVRTPPPNPPLVQSAVPAGQEPRTVLSGQPAASPAAKAAPQPFGPNVCPRCGSTDFSQGSLISYGTRFRPAYYKPDRRSIFTLHNALRPLRRLAEVEARACRRCGFVVFEVDAERLNRIDRPPQPGK